MRILISLVIPLLAWTACATELDGDELVPLVRGRFMPLLMPDDAATSLANAAGAKAFIELFCMSTGQWQDVDYNDPDDRSWWDAAVHLQRAQVVAIAFRDPQSPLRLNATAYAVARAATAWWIQHDPQNSNWWWMQIGVPRALGKLLLLVNDSALSGAGDALLARAVPHGFTGCNTVWIATARMIRSLLTHNESMLHESFAYAYTAVVMASNPQDDGIQSDMSFHQHGPQLYSGWGYGSLMTTNLLVLSHLSLNTTLAMSPAQQQLLDRFVCEGQQTVTRGANFFWEASGRLMTYFNASAHSINAGHYHYFAALSPYACAFPSFRPPATTPLAVIFACGTLLARSSLSCAASFSARLLLDDTQAVYLPRATLFPTSDYLVYTQRNFTVAIRGYSNRTLNSECVNDEGKQGRDLADGVTAIYTRHGDNYENAFPVWNWNLVPGTTEVQRTRTLTCAETRSTTDRWFVGGVSDTHHAAFAMDWARHPLSLHKVWFTFDETIAIALTGTAVADPASATLPVTTALQQSLLSSDSPVFLDGSPVPPTPTHTLRPFNVSSFLHHDHTGYVFARPTRLLVGNGLANGSWAAITQGPASPTVHKLLFTSAIDHGRVSASEALPFAVRYFVVGGVASADTMPSVAATLQREVHWGGNGVHSDCACRVSSPSRRLMHSVHWPHSESSSTQCTTPCWTIQASVPAMISVETDTELIFTVAFNSPVTPTESTRNATVVLSTRVVCPSSTPLNATHTALHFPLTGPSQNSQVVTCHSE